MKYIDWLKGQIKLSQFKNVIRFPIEKRLNQILDEQKNLVKKVDKNPNQTPPNI